MKAEVTAHRAELTVRVNGHHAAWPAKFADDGPRAADVRRAPYHAANTSVSLLVRRDGELLLHLLVDAGMGVINSLLELQESAAVDRIDAVALTHPHFDHIAGMDWLLASCSRSRVPGQQWPLPVVCSPDCFKAVFGRRGLFHWWHSAVEHRPIEAGAPVVVAGREGVWLRLAAVPVEHGPTAPGAVIYAIEFEADGVVRKIGLAWDMLRLAPNADPAPLANCDLLFVDSMTVHPQPDLERPGRHRNWHISVEESLLLTAPWAPRRTYQIHYSGSHDEDPPPHACTMPTATRALTHFELEQLASGLGLRLGRDLRVAAHGLTIPGQQPWPEP
ncbi:MAG: MBL fold metallo-hydrolase [Dehalococcoidia bacterium]